MLSHLSDNFLDLMNKGGPVMWVLLVMSIAAVAIVFERFWFWHKTNNRAELARVRRMEQMLRQGDWASVRVLAESDTSVYGRVISTLARDGTSQAVATSIVESQRCRLDRYMGLLSTMITAAPLVGLLGTVLGLILTFKMLSDTQMTSADPRNVSIGLAEALFNTAGGLAIAVVTIFPYNAFRVQLDRTLGRIETLLAAAGAAPAPIAPAKAADAAPVQH